LKVDGRLSQVGFSDRRRVFSKAFAVKKKVRRPILHRFYRRFLDEEDSAAFIKAVSQNYTTASLERLAEDGSRTSRRAAVLALGFIGSYESNAVVGRALCDSDRGVRMLAENGIRQIWCRAGNEVQRRQLGVVIHLNVSKQYEEAIDKASELIEQAPWFAEVWNQRAVAHYKTGHRKESIRDCHQALEINPYHFGAAAGMGQCYLEMHDTAAALECFRRALRLNPDLEGVRAQVVHLQRTIEGR